METEFPSYRRIPRLIRDVRITEKIDGTNGLIVVNEDATAIKVGSRNRWLSVESDNYGFAAWAYSFEKELRKLGPGYHYGEWYGRGINRGYGLNDRRFMLFSQPEVKPDCCEVATVLYEGLFHPEDRILFQLETLKVFGSKHVPGFMKPEGIVIEWTHAQGKPKFKITLEGDGHKGASASNPLHAT